VTAIFLSVFCEPFKLVPADSRRLEKTVNVTIRRQRHLDKKHDRFGLMGLGKTRQGFNYSPIK